MVILDRCNGSFNILDDLSIRICAPNKTEDLNLNLFNIITIIYELKTLTKHISCNCKCKLMLENVIHIESGIKICVEESIKIP